MKYLKVWTSFRETMAALSDSEKGRLFDAMLNYADCGEEPELEGGERYLWPVAKMNIDRMAQRNEQLKENGSKGGRPRRAEMEEAHPGELARLPFANDEELIKQQQENNEVFEIMEKAGFKLSTSVMDKVSGFIADYGKDAVIRAINECDEHSALSIAYMRKVLENKGAKQKQKDDDGLEKYEGWA